MDIKVTYTFEIKNEQLIITSKNSEKVSTRHVFKNGDSKKLEEIIYHCNATISKFVETRDLIYTKVNEKGVKNGIK